MKLGLINSAWEQAGKNTAYGIWQTKEIGFDCIDIFVDPLEASDMELRLIKYECERAGLPIVSVACVALGLVDFNPSVRKFHARRVRAYLDTARMFGARNVLLVLGEYVWQKEVISPESQWDWGVQGVRQLAEYASELGLEIALEMEPFGMSLLNDVPKMHRFLTEVDHRAAKANIDISHMVLAQQPAEAIQLLKGRIAHVHISDCDGKVHGDLPPGRGTIDFLPYLRAIKSLELDGITISVELEYSPQPDQIEAWVREAYSSTSRLMHDVGLRG